MADSLVDRMMRASKLDAQLYEEVEHDASTLPQAMLVVVIASVAAGLGNLGAVGPGGIIGLTLGALAGWLVWAALVYWIGVKLLPRPQTESDIGELLRTIGFSAAPGTIRIFGFVPALGPLIVVVGNLWMLVAMVVAVRQALDYEGTGRAVVVCIIGWLIEIVVLYALIRMLAP